MSWCCACGMTTIAVDGAPYRFTAEWHSEHRSRHLVAFPNVDEATKRNLDSFVEWAS